MKAMVATKFGGPDVLEMQELDKPEPGARQLLVKVAATSVNPVDCKIRAQGGNFGLEAPLVLGYDVSGVVAEVGEEVTMFEPGDEVFYTSEIFGSQGCNAEYHAVEEDIVAHKPVNLTHEAAASIPLAGGTAWQALMLRGALRLGDKVLIHGAGGVGSLAIQIAVAAGAQVYVSCSDYMVDMVKSWGVERVVNYKSEDFTAMVTEATEGEGVDVVFNTVGGDLLTRSIPITAHFGSLIGILDPEGSLEGAYRRNLSVELVFLQRDQMTMRELAQLALHNKIKPVVDSVVDLKDVAQAHRLLEQGGVRGKIVVRTCSE